MMETTYDTDGGIVINFWQVDGAGTALEALEDTEEMRNSHGRGAGVDFEWTELDMTGGAAAAGDQAALETAQVTVQDFLGVYRNGYFGLSLGLGDDGTLHRSLKTASHGGIDGATPYASYEVRDGVLYCNDPEGSDQFTLLEDGTLDARFYDDDYMNGIFQPDDGSVFET